MGRASARRRPGRPSVGRPGRRRLLGSRRAGERDEHAENDQAGAGAVDHAIISSGQWRARLYTSWFCSSGLVAADAGAPSNDHPKTPTRGEVESALAKKGSPGELQHWAATAEGILTAVAADRAASETVRGRALSALGYARTSRAHSFLENFIIEKTPSSARSPRPRPSGGDVARLAGGRAGGGGPGAAARQQRRRRAPRRRGRLGPVARAPRQRPLRARLAVETDPAVRRQIEAALKAVTATR